MTNRQLADAIWKKKHRDYRSRRGDGTRCVLTMGRTGMTESWPLDCIGRDDLLYLAKGIGINAE